MNSSCHSCLLSVQTRLTSFDSTAQASQMNIKGNNCHLPWHCTQQPLFACCHSAQTVQTQSVSDWAVFAWKTSTLPHRQAQHWMKLSLPQQSLITEMEFILRMWQAVDRMPLLNCDLNIKQAAAVTLQLRPPSHPRPTPHVQQLFLSTDLIVSIYSNQHLISVVVWRTGYLWF